MNKKKIILIILFVVGFGLGITAYLLNINDSSKMLELTYKTNGGVPYKWEYEIEDKNIVEFVKSYELDNENNGQKVGTPIYTNYVFKGLKEGTTTITFKYINITDKTIEKEEKLNIKVNSNKNISLVANLND